MRMLQRIVVYAWAAPVTSIGLLLAVCARLGGAQWRCDAGVLEVAGGRAAPLLLTPTRRYRYAALTLGHVILARDVRSLDRCRCHEYVHVRQYERWGVLLLPLYAGSSLLVWLRGGRPYRDNHFERQARAEAGEEN